jgi:molybdate transport system substrate-binding protein
MKNSRWISSHSGLARLAILIIAATAWALPAQAQLKVMTSGGFSSAYLQVLPEFEKANNLQVVTGSGASQGDGPLTIAAQLKRGVPTDVVILSREGLTELIAAGLIMPGTDADLASVPLGVAVRAGTPKPDVSTVEAFKRALVNAKTVAVPGSTSGIFLMEKIFPQLGIDKQITAKVKERGSQSAGAVVTGEANIVVQPVSELIHVAGLDYAGRAPDEVQLLQVFSAAVVAGSKEVEAARKLISFLASDRVADAKVKNGMDLVGKAATK